MFLELMVENFMSFREPSTFSLIATSDKELINDQVVSVNDKLGVLKTATIYGANASGKTNFLHAAAFIKDFIINSSKESQQGDLIDVNPFMFNTASENEASTFEITFVAENIIYRYGFEVSRYKVESEWLFARYSSRETMLFIREDQDISIGLKFKEGKKFVDAVRENALFLSVCAQFNGEISISILNWFRYLNVISSLDNSYVTATIEMLENEDQVFDVHKQQLLSLMTGIDVGIQDISLRKNDIKHVMRNLDRLPARLVEDILNSVKNVDEKDWVAELDKYGLVSHEVEALHKKFDENGNFVGSVSHDFGIESRGTQKIFELAGPIIDTMISGGILFIDEIQNSLHTKLVVGLVEFIIKNKLNKNAQFVFTTHDVNILASKLMRRDQFWFVDKNEYGESEMTCLVDFDEHVRKDANLDKDYLRGRYGAIPFVSLEDSYGDR